MTLVRRARHAALLLRMAAGFALVAEASLARLSLRFAAEISALLHVAVAAQIGGGLLLMFGILTRWVALTAMAAVLLTSWLLPATMLPMLLLWIAALAAIALLGTSRSHRGGQPPRTWRYLAGLARGADIFK